MLGKALGGPSVLGDVSLKKVLEYWPLSVSLLYFLLLKCEICSILHSHYDVQPPLKGPSEEATRSCTRTTAVVHLKLFFALQYWSLFAKERSFLRFWLTKCRKTTSIVWHLPEKRKEAFLCMMKIPKHRDFPCIVSCHTCVSYSTFLPLDLPENRDSRQ